MSSPKRRVNCWEAKSQSAANPRVHSRQVQRLVERFSPLNNHLKRPKCKQTLRYSPNSRRSAMISLSNLSDDRMRHAKTGNFPAHRYLANNSVAYTEKPDAMSFLREWTSLAESGSGERGIFNRKAAKEQAAKNGRRETDYEFGVNP